MLMQQMYKHLEDGRRLEDGRTTAQALRLAMLHLLRDSRWRRPVYWAAFLVVGANTRLPGVGANTRQKPSGRPPQGVRKRRKKSRLEGGRGGGEEEEVEDEEGEEEEEDEEGGVGDEEEEFLRDWSSRSGEQN